MAGYCEKKDPLEFSTEIEKWDQETPADGKEMAKPIEKLYNNTEFNKKGVEDVKNPEFDASGNASGITNFQKLIDSITSKMSIFSFFANLKTGLKYVLDVGKIVNNGTTTEAGKFVLDAIQANPNIAGTLAKQIKENQDAISSLNASKLSIRSNNQEDLGCYVYIKDEKLQFNLSYKGGFFAGFYADITRPESFPPDATFDT